MDDAGTGRQRGKSGGGRERGRGKPSSTREQDSSEDKDFMMDRLDVCREWNSQAGCKRTHCRKSHVCNQKSGPGKCCKGTHHAS